MGAELVRDQLIGAKFVRGRVIRYSFLAQVVFQLDLLKVCD